MSRLWMNLAAIIASICTLAWGPTAAAQDEASRPAAKIYVGQLAKAPGSAKIGLVVQGKDFLAYVCGKDDDFLATHARWFRGQVEDGKLTAEVNGAKLAAEVTDGKAQGVLTGSDKNEVEFTASAVKANGKAGIYRDEAIIGDEHYIVGWIRDDSGETVGAGGAAGKLSQVKPPVKKKGFLPDVAVAPSGSVGTSGNAKNVKGNRITDIISPRDLLPGQIFNVAALKNVDLKKNQFTVQDPSGRQISLPALDVVLRAADGTETPIEPRSLSINIRVGKTRVQIEDDGKGNRKVVITRD